MNPHVSPWLDPTARRVYDQMSDRFIALSTDDTILFQNRALEDVKGDIVGQSYWEVWPHLKGTLVEASYRKCREEGQPLHFQFYHPRGAWLDIDVYPSGTDLHIYFRNVTRQRLLAEAAELESELRPLIDAIPHIAWASDTSGSPVYLNARWWEYTGLDPATPYQASLVIYLQDEIEYRKANAVAISESRAYGGELRLRRADGQYRWHSVSVVPRRSNEGEFIGWVGTSTDVHDRRLAENAVFEAEKRLRYSLAAADAGVWSLDTVSNLGEWSVEYRELFGIGPEDPIPNFQEWLDRVHPDDRIRVGAEVREAMTGQVDFRIEYRIQHPAKGERWLATTGGRIAELPNKITGITYDITDSKRQVESLEARVQERTSELMAANETMRGFTYHVSHDLRTPLRAIVSTSRMIEMDYGDSIPEGATLLLRRQVEAGRKLGELIDDLLQLSRLSREEIQKQPVDLTEMAHEIWSDVLNVHLDSSVQFVVGDGLRTQADPRLLRLALFNLLENAVKYSPEGGKVHLGQEKGSFYISDQGIGFDPQYAERIFEPFQRLHRDEEFTGTGIGLANVKQVIERHGGTIFAEGTPGKGSIFRFCLERPIP